MEHRRQWNILQGCRTKIFKRDRSPKKGIRALKKALDVESLCNSATDSQKVERQLDLRRLELLLGIVQHLVTGSYGRTITRAVSKEGLPCLRPS